MGSCYNKYFASRDSSLAKAKMMFDIKNHILYGDELSELVDELERNGLLDDRPFSKESQDKWSDQYARHIATGFSLGFFSRNYIKYCAEVAEYLYQKKRRKKILVIFGIAGLIIVSLLIVFQRS